MIRRLGLHPTILLMAAAHLMADGYGNIYAPMLPILIPRLKLSLAAAGTLTMLFQIAASVAQVGFGHLADRWRPRTLIRVGPVVSVVILSLIGLASSRETLALILVVGGLGAAAFHPPAAALAHRLGGDRRGLAMSVYITGGTLGFSLGPLCFAPFAERFGLEWTPILALPGLAVVAFFLRRVPPIPLHPSAHRGFAALRPYAKPLALLYAVVVLRTLASLTFATFVPVMLTRRGLSLGEAGGDRGALSLRQRHWRVPRRSGSRPVWRPRRHRAGRSCCRAPSCSSRRSCTAGPSSSCSRSAACSCSRRFRSTSRSVSLLHRSARRRCRR